MGSKFAADLFDEYFGVKHIVRQQDDREVRGCGLSKGRGVSHARHDDIRPERHHHPVGLFQSTGRGNGEVQVRENRLAPGVAVQVVVDEQHQGRVPFLIALSPAAAPRAAPIRAAPLLVCLVRPSKGYDVAHECVVDSHILAALNTGVKGLRRYPSRSVRAGSS
jgi:hypothetical protein